MCRIVGFVNYKQDISKYKNILINMNHCLSRTDLNEDDYYIRKNVAMNHNCIVCDGPFDKDFLLENYINYGKDIVHHLNGPFAFAIWDNEKEELFIARDHLGIKPLFYTMQNNSFIFASEIKAIFKYPRCSENLRFSRYF